MSPYTQCSKFVILLFFIHVVHLLLQIINFIFAILDFPQPLFIFIPQIFLIQRGPASLQPFQFCLIKRLVSNYFLLRAAVVTVILNIHSPPRHTVNRYSSEDFTPFKFNPAPFKFAPAQFFCYGVL